MKNILFIASEAVPFIKTGGLADVVGSLPKCFDKQYFDVRVMIPKYLCIKESFRNEMKYVNHFYMDLQAKDRDAYEKSFEPGIGVKNPRFQPKNYDIYTS